MAEIFNFLTFEKRRRKNRDICIFHFHFIGGKLCMMKGKKRKKINKGKNYDKI